MPWLRLGTKPAQGPEAKTLRGLKELAATTPGPSLKFKDHPQPLLKKGAELGAVLGVMVRERLNGSPPFFKEGIKGWWLLHFSNLNNTLLIDAI